MTVRVGVYFLVGVQISTYAYTCVCVVCVCTCLHFKVYLPDFNIVPFFCVMVMS